MMRSNRAARTATAVLVIALATTLAVTASAAESRSAAGPTYKKIGGWGKTGAANGQFGANAYGITTDKSGKVYVADSDNERLQVFTASGGFVRKIQRKLDSFVRDVAIAPDGSLWLTDLNAGIAQQYSASGGELESISTPKQALGIGVDAKGSVFIATAGDNIAQVGRYDESGGTWQAGPTWGGFKTPHDVEVSPDGSVYVSDNGSLTVKRFDANGKLLKSIKAGASSPVGIGVDLDCNVWITNISQRRIDRYSPSGKLLGSATSGDLIAQDVAFGPKGDLYAYDGGAHAMVRMAEDRSKPGAAAVAGAVAVAGGVAKVKYTLSGVACPTQVSATASLSGGVTGKASVSVAAGRTTVLSIPVKGSGSSAQFKIVLKTNGRPTTQVASVRVSGA
jgi:streptogramin lyase